MRTAALLALLGLGVIGVLWTLVGQPPPAPRRGIARSGATVRPPPTASASKVPVLPRQREPPSASAMRPVGMGGPDAAARVLDRRALLDQALERDRDRGATEVVRGQAIAALGNLRYAEPAEVVDLACSREFCRAIFEHPTPASRELFLAEIVQKPPFATRGAIAPPGRDSRSTIYFSRNGERPLPH